MEGRQTKYHIWSHFSRVPRFEKNKGRRREEEEEEGEEEGEEK